MKLSKIRRSINKHIDRLTLYVLIAFYPLAAMILTISRVIEEHYFQWVAIVIGIILIAIASDASIRAKRRIRIRRGKAKKEAKDIAIGSSFLMMPLMSVGYAQHVFRKISSVGHDPEFITILGYQPSRESMFYLDLLGALWAILIAYIGKYYWDNFISLREESIQKKRNAKRLERQKKINEKYSNI